MDWSAGVHKVVGAKDQVQLWWKHPRKAELLFMPSWTSVFQRHWHGSSSPQHPSQSLILWQKQQRSCCPCVREHLIFLIGICEVYKENLLWSHLQRNAPMPRNYKAKIVSRGGGSDSIILLNAVQWFLWECGKAIWEAGQESEQLGPEHIVSYPSPFPPPCPWIIGRPRRCPRRLMASHGGEINTETPHRVIRLFNQQHASCPILLCSK